MIKTYLILIISFLFITPGQTHASYEEWGDFATAFLLPLTYQKHDAADFGSQADPQDLKILEQLKPTIFVAPEGLVPIDFYEDYLPYCFLKDSEMKWR